MNVDDAAAILGLARSPQVVGAILLAVLDWDTPAADAIAGFLVEKCRNGKLIALVGAETSASTDWARAQRLARHALQGGIADRDSAEWDATMSFFRASVQHGHANRAAELVVELVLREQWMPIHEALLAAGGDRDRLGRLAPEVRAPTEEILAFLQHQDLASEREVQPRRGRRVSAAPKPPMRAKKTAARKSTGR